MLHLHRVRTAIAAIVAPRARSVNAALQNVGAVFRFAKKTVNNRYFQTQTFNVLSTVYAIMQFIGLTTHGIRIFATIERNIRI